MFRYVVLYALRAIRDNFPFVLIRELFWYTLLPHGGGRGRYWAISCCCSFGVTFDRSRWYIDVWLAFRSFGGWGGCYNAFYESFG